MNGSTLSVVQRKSTNESPYQIDNVVNQSDFNIDKLDGTGHSKIILDPTKANLYIIDRAWLGVGTVSMGIMYNGRIVYCHKFHNSNINTTSYMKRASLPLRYELDNTSGSATNTMKQICCACISEGGNDYISRRLGTSSALSGFTATTTLLPVISIRLKQANIRSIVKPLSFELLTDSANPIRFFVFYNATLTNASFSSVNDISFIEADTSATAISGGIKYFTYTLTSGKQNTVINIDDKLSLSEDVYILSSYNNVSDIFTIAVQTSSSTANVWVDIKWIEIN